MFYSETLHTGFSISDGERLFLQESPYFNSRGAERVDPYADREDEVQNKLPFKVLTLNNYSDDTRNVESYEFATTKHRHMKLQSFSNNCSMTEFGNLKSRVVAV